MVEDWSFMILEWWEGSFSIPYFVLLRSKYLCTIVVVSLPNEYFCVFSVSAPTSERVCWMYSTVFMRRIQTRLTFFHECINLYFENICRRCLMNHSDILFISMSFSVHYYWKLNVLCRFFKQWFRWEFLCLQGTWLLSDEQQSSSLIGGPQFKINFLISFHFLVSVLCL